MDGFADAVLQQERVEKAKRTVYIKAVFLKIEDINTIQEYFSGLVFVKSRWREPALDSFFGKDVSNIKWEGMWGPKLDINNVLGEAKQQIWRDVQFNAKGEAFAVEKRRVKGNFTERMELQEFPFDIQDLSLLITSDFKEEMIQLEEDEEDLSSVVTDTFVDEQEWDLKHYVQCEPRAIISALSFTTFAVPRTLPQNRIQLSFILILACVTFKFAASQSVPKISYLTHLDRYILGSMIFLFFVAIWHGIVTRFEDHETDNLDFYAYITFIVVYVLVHALFFVTLIVRGYKRRALVQQRETEYLMRLDKSHSRESTNSDIPKTKWRLRPGPASKVGIKV
ncbi:cys-loop ligand-gated ion channel-like isoform X4 [Elysia marginata]|uniref:Cys-loop ligand-gated ion channel-like isoform X4 n=1 Tax=Elysia marginata TaxID=1093978 RepID=A0AAV4HHY0_9GAST|nr:cys-loop ligand-gated ion channel-like isoform X4 [Elysia marginata]